MREIKFRAWDKEMKTMLSWEELQAEWVAEGYFDSVFMSDHWIPLQYTGLKDKNGKEIYEGDILRVETGWYKSKKINHNDRFDSSIKGVTYWTVEHRMHSNRVGYMVYGIDRRFNKVLTPNMICNNKAEVVGNIHDNPELLEMEVEE